MGCAVISFSSRENREKKGCREQPHLGFADGFMLSTSGFRSVFSALTSAERVWHMGPSTMFLASNLEVCDNLVYIDTRLM